MHSAEWPGPYRHARLIGLGHKARQGKDLAARLLMERFPGRVHRVAFADALYAHARLVYGMGRKDAQLLQRVGMDMREAGEVDVWLRLVAWRIADIDADAREPFLAVIPDCRFPNEFAFVKRHGGTTVRLRRFDRGRPYVDPSRPADHISEIALDDAPWDVTAAAETGDFAALRCALEPAAQRLLLSENLQGAGAF